MSAQTVCKGETIEVEPDGALLKQKEDNRKLTQEVQVLRDLPEEHEEQKLKNKRTGSVERGQMPDFQYKKIQGNYTTLQKQITKPIDVCRELFSAFIFDEDDKRKIESEKDRFEQTDKLLMILLERGPHAFDAFLRALSATGHCQAKHILEQDGCEDVADIKEDNNGCEDVAANKEDTGDMSAQTVYSPDKCNNQVSLSIQSIASKCEDETRVLDDCKTNEVESDDDILQLKENNRKLTQEVEKLWGLLEKQELKNKRPDGCEDVAAIKEDNIYFDMKIKIENPNRDKLDEIKDKIERSIKRDYGCDATVTSLRNGGI